MADKKQQDQPQAESQAVEGIPAETLQQAQAAGLNLSLIRKLIEAAVTYGPQALALLRELVDFFNRQPVFGHDHEDPVHQLSCKNLSDALQSACSAACLHEEICGHEDHSE